MVGDVSQVLKSGESLKNPYERDAKYRTIVEFSGGPFVMANSISEIGANSAALLSEPSLDHEPNI
jgi:hypothetical protein